MKKISGIVLCVLLISLCAFALADVEINASTFPDENFREYVRQFDTDGNGSFSDEELTNIRTINAPEKKINSLSGIEYFTELIYLRCHNNQLTSIDVSKNAKLTFLACSGNRLTRLMSEKILR